MTNKTYRLALYKIDDDGDLAFRHFYYTDNIPQINSTISYLISNEDGKYTKRIYYKVKDILYPTIMCELEKNSIIEFDNPILHCEIILDEKI